MSSTATRTALGPLRALRYDQAKVDLADVVAPPYDVVTEPQRAALIRRCEYSIVRLELPDDADAQAAATLMHRWTRDGVLARDDRPALWWHEQTFTGPDGVDRVRRGFFAAVRLSPYDEGRIRPHEHTHASVRAERLELMRATRANLSPILGVYDDPDGTAAGRLGSAAAGDPEMHATDSDGTVHRFWEVTDPAAIGAVRDSMAECEILIADGHHRYETALAYRDERRAAEGDPAGDRPYDFILMCLCNLRDEGLAIYPTHRVVMSHREVDRRFLQAFSVRELPAGTPAAVVEAELNEVPIDTIAFARLARLRASGADRRAERSVGGDAGHARRPGRGARDRRRRAAGTRALAAARPRRGAVPDDRRRPLPAGARPCDGAGRLRRGRRGVPAARPDRRAGAERDGVRTRDAAEVDVLLPEAVVGLPAQPAVGRLRADWLEFCQGVAADVDGVLRRLPTRDDREPVVGRGVGGDDTTVVDQEAESAVVRRLEALAGRGISFQLVSEELGERAYGDGDSRWRVVVDPIDGSLNAKRGLPFYCISIAFADGPALSDVAFGYVRDFGSGEEWVATRGGGATVNGRPLGGVRPKDRLGVVDLEATDAGLVARGRAPAGRQRRPHPVARRPGAGAVPAGRRAAGRRLFAQALAIGRRRRRGAGRARGRRGRATARP